MKAVLLVNILARQPWDAEKENNRLRMSWGHVEVQPATHNSTKDLFTTTDQEKEELELPSPATWHSHSNVHQNTIMLLPIKMILWTLLLKDSTN